MTSQEQLERQASQRSEFLLPLRLRASKFVRQMTGTIRAVHPKHFISREKMRYSAGGLISQHHCEFLKDPDFKRAYGAAMKATGRDPTNNNFGWRAHTICWAAKHAGRIPGDFVECGVWEGMYSLAAIEYIGFTQMADRKFYLFDTFNGLDLSLLNEAENKERRRYEKKNAQLYQDFYEKARNNFAHVTNAVLVRGSVPSTLSSVSIDKVAYLSIDMNCATPEIAAIRHFWPKLSTGAVIVLDDYGFDGHEEQMHGINNLGKELGFEVMSLPTGQGLILKA